MGIKKSPEMNRLHDKYRREQRGKDLEAQFEKEDKQHKVFCQFMILLILIGIPTAIAIGVWLAKKHPCKNKNEENIVSTPSEIFGKDNDSNTVNNAYIMDKVVSKSGKSTYGFPF